MPVFRVMAEAENLPAADDPNRRVGFCASRILDAPNLAAAEALALQSVRDEYADIFQTASIAGLFPILAVIEAEQIEQWPDAVGNRGATWFPM